MALVEKTTRNRFRGARRGKVFYCLTGPRPFLTDIGVLGKKAALEFSLLERKSKAAA